MSVIAENTGTGEFTGKHRESKPTQMKIIVLKEIQYSKLFN
jgi:hypothetical protein